MNGGQKIMMFDLLKDISRMYPEYSFGEVLFTLLRPKYLKGAVPVENIKWLREIPDNDFFTAAEKAKKDI